MAAMRKLQRSAGGRGQGPEWAGRAPWVSFVEGLPIVSAQRTFDQAAAFGTLGGKEPFAAFCIEVS